MAPKATTVEEKQVENLADDIRERTAADRVAVDLEANEVFVLANDDEDITDPLIGMDGVVTVAFDHGFVPVGMTKSGASRFTLRGADNVAA